MKTVLTSTFEFFARDPRAYKIDVALAGKYDVYAFVRNEDLKEFERPSLNFKLFSKDVHSNRFVRLFCFWMELIKYAKEIKPDIFVAHNYYLVWPAYVIKKKLRCKVVYDSYELYVPSKRNKISRRQWLFYLIEKWCLRSFDLVMAANENRAKMMKVKFNLAERPLSVMNISSSLFTQENNTDFINTHYPSLLEYDNKVKLVYQGVLSGDRKLLYLIDIIRYLDARFIMIFVGDGPERQKLENRANELKVEDRVVFTGRVPMKDISPILSYCDYGIVSYPFTDYNNRYCAPNKIFEYPGAGIPMISSAQTTIALTTRGYDIVQFVDYAKIEVAAEQIKEFVGRVNKDNAKEDIMRFVQNVNWDKEARKMLSRLSAL